MSEGWRGNVGILRGIEGKKSQGRVDERRERNSGKEEGKGMKG